MHSLVKVKVLCHPFHLLALKQCILTGVLQNSELLRKLIQPASKLAAKLCRNAACPYIPLSRLCVLSCT